MAKKTSRKTAVLLRRGYKKDPCAAIRLKCTADKTNLRKAAAIVGQVIAHFGAGYASERAKTQPTGAFPQIFEDPTAFATFYDLLLQSTLTNLADLNWDTDPPARDDVCEAAFKHGELVFQSRPSGPLPFSVILDTLRTIQEQLCPIGAGGGKICRF